MDSVYLVQFIFWYLQQSKVEGGILFLDQEKAFDRVDHEYMFKVMTAFGFPEDFINNIRTLYKGAKSMIKINGFLSDSFDILSGVRQGDPLSPLLFVLVIETLAILIRTDQNIFGIKLPGLSDFIKVILYADDTAIPFSFKKELPFIKKALDLYCGASASKLNLKKCIGIIVNGQIPEESLGMIWEVNTPSLRYLGVQVGCKPDFEADWQKCLENIARTLSRWSRRNLSTQGRILIIKSLALSKIQYLAFSTHMVIKSVLKPLEAIISSFFWKGKRGKIALNTLELPYERGGLEALSVAKYSTSLRIRALFRAFHPDVSEQPWAKILKFTLQNCLNKSQKDIGEILVSAAPAQHLKLPKFWAQCFKDWQSFFPSFSFVSFS